MSQIPFRKSHSFQKSSCQIHGIGISSLASAPMPQGRCRRYQADVASLPRDIDNIGALILAPMPRGMAMSSMSRAQLADMGDIGAHWHTMSLPPCTPRDFGGGAIDFLSARHHSGPNFFPKLTNPLKISRPANLWVKEPPSILRLAEIWGFVDFCQGWWTV